MTLGKAGTAALVSGGVTLAGGGSLKEALMAGATGYFGGGGTIGGFSPMSTLGGILPGAAGSALNTGLTTGILGAGIGKLGGMSTRDALRAGLTSGLSAAALQGLENSRAGTQPTPAQAQTGTQQQSPFSGMQGDNTAQSMLSTLPDQRMAFSSPSAPAAAPVAAAGAESPGFFSRLFGTTAPAAALTPSAVTATGAAGTTAAAAGMGLVPKIGLGLLAAGALGGFKSKDNTNPISEAELNRYKESVRLAEERDKFVRGGGYGLETPVLDRSFNPIVSTDYSAAMPFMAAPPVVPTGITRSPAGVAQPYNLAGMYGVPTVYDQNAMLGAQGMYGVQGLAKGGEPVPTNFPRKTGPINGPGTGTSDDIPAMLSDGEFVFTAKAVRNAGAGSRRKGAKRMYKLMKMLEGGPVKGK
jgi:hypothetical protein